MEQEQKLIVTNDNVDLLVKESVELFDAIKNLEARRQTIANGVRDYMISRNQDMLVTDFDHSIYVAPTLEPTFGRLSSEERQEMIDWAYHNQRDLLTIIPSKLATHVAWGDNKPPVHFSPKAYMIRIMPRPTDRMPRPLSELSIPKKKEPRVRVPKPPKPIPVNDRLTPIARNAEIIKEYFYGPTKVTLTSLAKKHGISDKTVKQVVRRHERKLLREIVDTFRPTSPKSENPLYTSTI